MSAAKILLVDDADFFLEVEKGFLRQTPAEILIAKNGREALEAAARHCPALIFMDVQMPLMDGLTCLRRLKADPKLRSIPVVMVFAPGRDMNEKVCLEAGADAILLKPLVKRDFLELGRRFLFHIDRREKRVSYQALVTLHLQGEDIHCSTEDLSVRGAYINCRHILEQDERMRVTMVLPGTGGAVLKCRGQVAWLNQGFPRPMLELPQGFGIEFQEIDRKMGQVLLEIVESYGDDVKVSQGGGK